VSGSSCYSCSICWPKVEVPVHLNFDHMGAKASALPQISEPCLIFRHKYFLIAKCDWQCSAGSVITNHMTFAEETPVDLNVDEFCFFIRNTYLASCFGCTSNVQLMINWSPLLQYPYSSTHAVYHAISPPEEHFMSHFNSLQLKWSLIITKNANEIPL
jgi:hypothetical protein